MENNANKKKKSIFSDRRFKYGSLAVGLTAAFIAMVVIINAVVYALAYSYGWYIDLTGTQYYGITDSSKKYLDDIMDKDDVQVKIIFCQEKDRVLDDSAGYYVYRCAETYKKEYPNNVKVEYMDIVSNPKLADIYTSQLGKSLYSTDVIIETEKNFRVVSYENFFTFDEDSGEVYAFNGERRFTSYILALCTEYPICYFTTGHGESIYDSEGEPNAIYRMMEDAGFDVRTIDLSKEDIDDEAMVVIINNPVYDFMNADDAIDETHKLGRFMSDEGGNMMVFLSPEHQANLTNLKFWLEEWGIGIEDGKVKDTSNSLSPDGFSVVADYPTDGFAASLHSTLRDLDSTPMTIVKDPLVVRPLWESRNAKSTGVVLYSHSSSAHCTDNGELTGSYPIATLVRQTHTDPLTSSKLNTYMFVSSAGYADGSYLDSNAYGNKDIIQSLAMQMGKKLVPLDIDFKVFASEELSITTAAAYTWTIILSAVLPLAVAVVGGVICYRRKRL